MKAHLPILALLLLLLPSAVADRGGREQGPPADRLFAVAFTPDGKGLWVDSHFAGIRLIDAETGTEIRSLSGPAAGQGRTFLCLSPDGRLLAASTGGTVKVWNTTDGTLAGTWQPKQYLVSWAQFAPDGKSLLTEADRGTPGGHDVVLWSVPSGEPIRRLEGHTTLIYGLAFDGHRAVTCGASGDTVRVWDVDAGKETAALPATATVPVLLPGERAVTATGGEATVWDLAAGKPLATLKETGGNIYALALSPDGSRLAEGSSSVIRIWDLSTYAGTVLADSHSGGEPEAGPVGEVEALAWSPDGTRLAAGGYEPVVRIWDVKSGKEVARFPASPPQKK